MLRERLFVIMSSGCQRQLVSATKIPLKCTRFRVPRPRTIKTSSTGAPNPFFFLKKKKVQFYYIRNFTIRSYVSRNLGPLIEGICPLRPFSPRTRDSSNLTFSHSIRKWKASEKTLVDLFTRALKVVANKVFGNVRRPRL